MHRAILAHAYSSISIDTIEQCKHVPYLPLSLCLSFHHTNASVFILSSQAPVSQSARRTNERTDGRHFKNCVQCKTSVGVKAMDEIYEMHATVAECMVNIKREKANTGSRWK